MRIQIEETRCDGHGLCVVEAPEVFDLNDDDIAVVKAAAPPAELEEQVNRAVAVCPKAAITIQE